MDLKVAAINDLSGLGRCSLAADLTALGALGIQACAIPTAVLTAQTGYPGYHSTDLTESLPYYTEHWSRLGEKMNGILTGFLNSAGQAKAVNDFIDRFLDADTLLLVDPVMADTGHVYANYSEDLLREMNRLVRRADIITPNITELALLSGHGLEDIADSGSSALLRNLRSWAKTLSLENGKTVLVTGIPNDAAVSAPSIIWQGRSGKTALTGFPAQTAEPNGTKSSLHHMIGNLVVTPDEEHMYLFPQEKGSYSGTGDLFAAIILGGRLLNIPWEEIISCAGDLIAAGVRDANRSRTDYNDGIPYEKYLWMLTDLVRSRS